MKNQDALRKRESSALAEIFDMKKKELGLTQVKLAEKFGISQNAISKYLTGRIPLNLNAAVQFANELNVSVGDFSPRLEEEIQKISQANTAHITQNNHGNGVQNNHNSIIQNSSSLKNYATDDVMPDQSFAPTIPQGTPLRIDESQTQIIDGKIYCVEYGGATRYRRLFRLPESQQIALHTDNPLFPNDTLAADKIRIIGRVVAWVIND